MVKQRNGYVNPIRNGGGNIASDNSVIVRRTAALGDCVVGSCISDKLIKMGYAVTYQAHTDMHCMLRRLNNRVFITEPGNYCHINLDRAYEDDPQKRVKHMARMFIDVSNQQLHPRGINLGQAFNCKPHISVTQVEKISALNKFKDYPRPWVFICPRSNAFNVRQVQDGVWEQAAQSMRGTKFWLGMHPAPPGIVDLNCRHLDNLFIWLSVADIMVSVDTGPLHIAAALGIPCIAISQSFSTELRLSNQCDFVSIGPRLDCVNCQQNVCPIQKHIPPCQNVDPQLIANWTNARLGARFNSDVSAVVAVYRPEAAMVNRCLESLLPQVSEIYVVRDLFGEFPSGLIQHSKIRYITMPQHDVGYGKKMLYGTRHTNGKYVLHCNDDAWLDPDCVYKLKSIMKPDVGIATPLLRYENGTIYHAGKLRTPGLRGWGHLDHRKHLPTFTDITELENTCGCVILINRQAFYEVDGYDEEFYLYAEDDDFALRIRQAGYRILFHPGATGHHTEHQSVNKTPGGFDHLNTSNALFGKKWGWYFDLNANRVPGKFE